MRSEIRNKLLAGLAAIVTVFAAAACASVESYTVAETVAQDPSIPHITIKGVIYHAETFGDPEDPVVITIHGGPGGDYRSLLSLQDLSDEYYVVFYDQRGTGLSPRVDPSQITLESSISDLDSIIDYYGGGRKVNLVGHSWGAMLASAYIGRYPHKVDHVVLAEPGFLNTEFAEEFLDATRIRMSFPILRHLLKTKREARRIDGPDKYASDDFYAYQINMYQGDDHPQAGYRCEGVKPSEDLHWRNGAAAAESITAGAVDEKGNVDINLVDGVENFDNTILFMSGACQTIIGVDWQKRQMKLFNHATLVTIPDAGHEMFYENPEASVMAVRTYLHTPNP